jgi:hypothetical protein
MKGRDPRAVVLGGGEEAHRHAHRVGRRVGDAHGDLHLGVEVGFEAQRLRGGELLGGDAARRTALEERLEEREVLLGDRDEQPVVVLERTGADPLEDPVLLDALDRGLAVADGIAAPAVQQPVMAPRRSRGQLAALDEGDAQAAQREVVRECGSGTASADDEDVRVVSRQVHRVRRVRRLSERRRACRRLPSVQNSRRDPWQPRFARRLRGAPGADPVLRTVAQGAATADAVDTESEEAP